MSLEQLHPGVEKEILTMNTTLPELLMVHEDRINHECTWQVSVENFSECHHCPVVHKYLTTQVYSPTEYRISIEGDVVKHYTPRLKERELHGDLHIWFLLPNLSIQLQPLYHSESIRQFVAKGPRESKYMYRWFADPDLPEQQLTRLWRRAAVPTPLLMAWKIRKL